VAGIASVEFLVGTSERRARLAPIGCVGFLPGESHFARLHVEGERVALLPGDRFIVRGFSRTATGGATLGGGVVLDVAPPRRRRSDPELARELARLAVGDVDTALRERIRRAGYAGRDTRELTREVGLDARALEACVQRLETAGDVARAGAHILVDAPALARLRDDMEAALDAFHASEPMRPGMQRAALRGRLPENVPPAIADCALAGLEHAGVIASEGELVRRPAHRARLDPAASAATERILADAVRTGLEPLAPRDWAEQLGVSLERFRDLVAHLERERRLVRAPGDLWFDTGAVEKLRDRVVAHLERHGELDTQSYKALIGTSRRTAMPLMELLDELHVTRRQGDARVLRKG
jgi:selenocysteine-specific elongation factor